MPNFNEENMENFRAMRVVLTDVPDELNKDQVLIVRQVIEDDLQEEQRRLESAQEAVKLHEANLEALYKKSEALWKKYGE